MNILRTTSENNDFIALVDLLNADLAIRDGEEHDFYSQFNNIDVLNNVVLIYSDTIAVSCGAFKEFDRNSVEIKRMYTLPNFRGKCYASQTLVALEKWAHELHYSACVLETGVRQPEAIGLYEKNGYKRTINYPPYEDMENSVCFKKLL